MFAGILGSLVICAAGAAGAGVTLGQIGADQACTTPGDIVAVQTTTAGDVSYTVPSGLWVITSWSAAGGPEKPGKEALVVFRSTGAPNEYRVVGATSAHELSSAKNAFDARIKVKGSDLIGLWAESGTLCAHSTGSPSDTASIFFPSAIPSGGTTMTLQPGYAVGYRLNMKVTLEIRPAASG